MTSFFSSVTTAVERLSEPTLVLSSVSFIDFKLLVLTQSLIALDHAAMVLKFASEPNEVFLLDATSNHGVALKRWSNLKEALGSFYSKIVIRHLNWERPDESLAMLEELINATEGNEYSFKAKYLKKQKSR